MTTELDGKTSPPLSLALWPQRKDRTSRPRPWAGGQQRGVVEGEKIRKHLCAPASRVAKSDRRCLLHKPMEPPGGHTLPGLMVPTVAFIPSKFPEATVRLSSPSISDLR